MSWWYWSNYKLVYYIHYFRFISRIIEYSIYFLNDLLIRECIAINITHYILLIFLYLIYYVWTKVLYHIFTINNSRLLLWCYIFRMCNLYQADAIINWIMWEKTFDHNVFIILMSLLYIVHKINEKTRYNWIIKNITFSR